MTIFEKAVSYVGYCRANGYTCDIEYDVGKDRYMVFTAGGTSVNYFYSVMALRLWLAQRYDDEKEAGNI